MRMKERMKEQLKHRIISIIVVVSLLLTCCRLNAQPREVFNRWIQTKRYIVPTRAIDRAIEGMEEVRVGTVVAYNEISKVWLGYIIIEDSGFAYYSHKEYETETKAREGSKAYLDRKLKDDDPYKDLGIIRPDKFGRYMYKLLPAGVYVVDNLH